MTAFVTGIFKNNSPGFRKRVVRTLLIQLSAATSPQQLTTSSKGTSNQSPKLEKKTQRGSKQYSCSTCGKLFSTPGYLETHQRLHSGEKPYMCPICGRKFAQRPGYTYHMRTHSGKHHVLYSNLKKFK